MPEIIGDSLTSTRRKLKALPTIQDDFCDQARKIIADDDIPIFLISTLAKTHTRLSPVLPGLTTFPMPKLTVSSKKWKKRCSLGANSCWLNTISILPNKLTMPPIASSTLAQANRTRCKEMKYATSKTSAIGLIVYRMPLISRLSAAKKGPAKALSYRIPVRATPSHNAMIGFNKKVFLDMSLVQRGSIVYYLC